MLARQVRQPERAARSVAAHVTVLRVKYGRSPERTTLRSWDVAARRRIRRHGLRRVVAVSGLISAFVTTMGVPHASAEEWGPLETLTRPGVVAGNPQLLRASDESLVAAWTGTDGSIFDPQGLVLRTRPPDGVWSPEQVIDPGSHRGMRISLDGDDRVVATFAGGADGTQMAITQNSDGSFEPAVALAPLLPGFVEDRYGGPYLAVDANAGQQAVVWLQRVPGEGSRVVAVRRATADAPWSAPKFLSPPGVRVGDLGVDGAVDGSVAVMWTVGGRPGGLRFRLLGTDGTWTARERAGAARKFAHDIKVANRGGGRVTAWAWA